MKTYTLLASLFASGAVAQSGVADCTRTNSPDWNDCDALFSSLGWTAHSTREITRNCNRDTDIASECLVHYLGNCQVAQCFFGDACIGTSEGRMVTSKTIVESQCRADDLAGRVSDESMYFEIQRYGTATRHRRSIPLNKKGMSFAEYTRLYGKDRDTAFSKVIDEGESKEKRQNPEWINLVTRESVLKPDERRRVNTEELLPGQELTWTDSSSYTIDVGVTSGISADLFSIFSASMEISTSYSETFSAGTSLTFNSGSCPGNANVYYAPIYTQFVGIWSDEPDTNVEVWIPQTVGGVLEGRFIHECVGSAPPTK